MIWCDGMGSAALPEQRLLGATVLDSHLLAYGCGCETHGPPVSLSLHDDRGTSQQHAPHLALLLLGAEIDISCPKRHALW